MKMRYRNKKQFYAGSLQRMIQFKNAISLTIINPIGAAGPLASGEIGTKAYSGTNFDEN